MMSTSSPAAVTVEPKKKPMPIQTPTQRTPAVLELEDGTQFRGSAFGAHTSTSGELVFSTGMVGYVESMTDPSFEGQLLVNTYPMIGNYGVPTRQDEHGLETHLESNRIHVAAMVVADYSETHSHWDAHQSLEAWMQSESVPGITGVDTRAITQHLRERGSMLARLIVEGDHEPAFENPNSTNLVEQVTCSEPTLYGESATKKRVLLIDTGAKYNIVHSLLLRDVEVLRVPASHDITNETFDALMLSNGPGDPTMAGKAIESIRYCLKQQTPIFGICLGHQLLALAIGAKTYKLKYGHRGQNQPVIECGTNRAFVTSQNHGYAVDGDSLPSDWRPWYENLNDQTNEGIRHAWAPFRSVQFHPEANPGPVDAAFLFDEFIKITNERNA